MVQLTQMRYAEAGAQPSSGTLLIHELLGTVALRSLERRGRRRAWAGQQIVRVADSVLRRLRGFRAEAALRARLPATTIRARSPRLVCFGCRDEERELVRGLDGDAMMAVGAVCLEYLPLRSRPPGVSIFFFGEDVNLRSLAGLLGIALDGRDRSATWHAARNAALIAMARYPTQQELERVCVHELTHAYLGILARNWRLPAALAEALAIAMEVRFVWDRASSDRVPLAPAPVPPGQAHPREDEYWPVSKLLSDRPAAGPLERSMCCAAYTLLCCLALINRSCKRIDGLLLSAYRDRVPPNEWGRWLRARLGMDEETLEALFRHFWVTGTLPSRRDDMRYTGQGPARGAGPHGGAW